MMISSLEPSAKIRVGFVGAGKQAQSCHLRYYSRLPECEATVIVDADEDLGRRVAGHFGVPRVETSHTALIERGGVDACVLTLPSLPSAERVVIDFLEAGIPCMVEKPLAASPAGAARILEAAQRTGTLLRVGFHKRSDPATLAAMDEIDRLKTSGELGRMTYVRIHVSLAGDWIAGGRFDVFSGTREFASEVIPAEDFPGMNEAARKLCSQFSGGHGHQFDWMRLLLGEPYSIAHVEPTQVLLTVRSASGIPAAFEFTPYRSTKDWVENAMVCFESGYLRIDLPPPLAINRPGTLEIFSNGRDGSGAARTFPVFGYDCAMREQARQFLRAVRGGTTRLCTPGEAMESIGISREWSLRLTES